MKVCVVVSGGKIASIDIVEDNDTPSYLSSASSLISTILSTQSTNVDTVSGATYSSRGIIEAVRSALSQAAVNGSSNTAGRQPEQYQ
ncbi:MAG: FMN-binding protein [Blautia sp.]